MRNRKQNSENIQKKNKLEDVNENRIKILKNKNDEVQRLSNTMS